MVELVHVNTTNNETITLWKSMNTDGDDLHMVEQLSVGFSFNSTGETVQGNFSICPFVFKSKSIKE